MSVKPSGQTRQDRRGGVAERQRGGKAAALGNTEVLRPVSAADARDQRWFMRDRLRSFTKSIQTQRCGVASLGKGVALREGVGPDGKAGYSGLATCGSVWICPVCSAKIASSRKEDVSAVIEHALAEGVHVSMLTLTQRHHSGQRLAELWDGLIYAWDHVASGRRWEEFRAQMGWVGFVKATEVTVGANGWHTHLHVLCFTEEDVTSTPYIWQRKQGRARRPYPVEVSSAVDFIANRWEEALAKKGIDFIADKGGIDWETARDARSAGAYVAKIQGNSGGNDLAAEATLGGFKRARRGNRTPFQLLADIIEKADPADLKLWQEYEKASRGRRALTWSRGLRDWAALGRDKTDEEIAQEDLGGADVAVFNKEGWRKVREAGATTLLRVLEEGGRAAAYAWLDERDIFYLSNDPSTREADEERLRRARSWGALYGFPAVA